MDGVEANTILFTPRKLNGIAHLLAQKGLFLFLESRWLSSPPSFIQDVLLNDS